MAYELHSKPKWLKPLFPWQQQSIEVKDAGHFIQEDAGQEVAQRIVEWMRLY